MSLLPRTDTADVEVVITARTPGERVAVMLTPRTVAEERVTAALHVFVELTDIAVDSEGTVAVVDKCTNKLYSITLGGRPQYASPPSIHGRGTCTAQTNFSGGWLSGLSVC